MILQNTYIGCSGWSIPKTLSDRFPAEGSHLQRYAQRFSAVEINSSFYRSHKPETYAKWAASTPESFRFAVKMPRQITHIRRLSDTEALPQFLSEISALEDKLGTVLMQLPPGLAFNTGTVRVFCAALRENFSGKVVCEPRHASWFAPEAEQILSDFHITRAITDPPGFPTSEQPGGWRELVYFRLHGSPRMYYSSYSAEQLDSLAESVKEYARSAEVWCIFNNTAASAATANALYLLKSISYGDACG